MSQTLNGLLGDCIFTIRDAFKEERQAIFRRLIQKEVDEHIRIYAELFDKNKQAIEAIAREGLEIPYEFRVGAEVALSHRLLNEIEELEKDFEATVKKGKIDRIVEEARQYGYHLRREEPLLILNGMLKERMEALQRAIMQNQPPHPEEVREEKLEEVILLLDLAEKWGFELWKEEPQNLMGEMLDECVGGLEKCWWGEGAERRPFPPTLTILAEKLGFNAEKFSKMISGSAGMD